MKRTKVEILEEIKQRAARRHKRRELTDIVVIVISTILSLLIFGLLVIVMEALFLQWLGGI